jgi:hypothetical protein
MKKISLAILLAVCTAWAHAIPFEDCLEGAEFIGNAARLRDSGRPEGTEEVFVSRAIVDLEMIRAYPPEFRWFAQDELTERFLLSEILRVWREIQSPEQHYQSFLDRCINQ